MQSAYWKIITDTHITVVSFFAQDWVDFEEVGDLEERIVSNYFETMLASIHQVIGSAEGPGQIANVENAESCPKASANDEENVSCILLV